MKRKVMDLGGGWTSAHINLEGSKAEHVYYYKNKKAKKVAIRNKKGQQFAAYSLILKDLIVVSRWIKRCLGIVNALDIEYEKRNKSSGETAEELEELYMALLVASLTTYGKCFTSAHGRKLRLNKKIIGQEHLASHEEVMEARHQFAAHAGIGDMEIGYHPYILFSRPDKRGNVMYEVTSHVIAAILWKKSELERFLELTDHVKALVRQRLDKIETSIVADINVKGMRYWAAKAT